MKLPKHIGLPGIVLVCFISGARGADGFGRNTTGGAGGTTHTVTSAGAFQTLVETENTPYIIQVQGTIDLGPLADGKVRIQSNKTIRGVGESPTIVGSLGFKKGCSNIIIERVNITCPKDHAKEDDGISLKEEITNVFITRCTFYDCYDGCLDITRRSDWITVSWCKFYFTSRNSNNNRVMLIGGGDNHDDQGTLHVTLHHNWFGALGMQRIPSLRYGRGHLYNNYYHCPGNMYCIRSRIQAECLIENNYFESVNDPYYIYIDDEPPEEYGKISASGNIRINCTGQVDDGDDMVFTPPYSYATDDTQDVPIIVQWGAGADGMESDPPHWLFGPYGDFDRNAVVDANDLFRFIEYWLDTEGIAEADYNNDGRVNIYEFALFTGHWLGTTANLTAPVVPTMGNSSIEK